MPWAAFALVAALAAPGDAPAPTRNPEICAVEAACRLVPSIELQDTRGGNFKIKIDERVPWLNGGTVMIFNNETVVIALKDDGAGRLTPSVVATGEAAASRPLQTDEVRFALSPQADHSYHLMVTNHLAKAVNYQAIIGVAGRGPGRTSVCTLRPNVFTVERWENALVQIAVSNFVIDGREGCF